MSMIKWNDPADNDRNIDTAATKMRNTSWDEPKMGPRKCGNANGIVFAASNLSRHRLRRLEQRPQSHVKSGI
jgi:hypothetical protein